MSSAIEIFEKVKMEMKITILVISEVICINHMNKIDGKIGI